MLIVFSGWSQVVTKDTRPVTFPFWMVQEIALDLEEKDRLEMVDVINTLRISALNTEIDKWSALDKHKVNQIRLKDKFISILQSQYEAERVKKDYKYKFTDFLKDIGKVGIGAVLGFVLFLFI